MNENGLILNLDEILTHNQNRFENGIHQYTIYLLEIDLMQYYFFIILNFIYNLPENLICLLY